MYNLKSSKAEEFISHEEILQTLDYANQNKSNEKLIDEILEKAKKRKGLNHREASVLLSCDIKEKNDEIFALAEQFKKISTATALFCLPHFIFQTTVSTVAHTAHIMQKTRLCRAKS